MSTAELAAVFEQDEVPFQKCPDGSLVLSVKGQAGIHDISFFSEQHGWTSACVEIAKGRRKSPQIR